MTSTRGADQKHNSEDRPKMLNPFDSTFQQNKAEFLEMHPACMTMSEWTPTDCSPPRSFGRFPILEICPEAPGYLAKAGHFTARDLRAIVAMLDLDIDHRDPEKIYRYILERSEKAPWVLPIFETMVADKRKDGVSLKPRRKNKPRVAMYKMPLMKLRLEQNPHLHNRTGELHSTPVQPDLAVAAFFEYAILNYYQKLKENDPTIMFNEALEMLVNEPPAKIVSGSLGDIEDVVDWEGHADLIIELVADFPEAFSVNTQTHALTTFRHLAANISLATDPFSLYRIARLAHACGKQAEALQAPRRDTVLIQISRLGFEFDPDKVDDRAITTISAALDEGLASHMRAQAMMIADLEENILEIKEKIHAAGQNEDYALLSELAPKASAGKEALGTARAARRHLEDCLVGLLSGDVCDHNIALEKILEKVSKSSDDRATPVGSADILTADLFDASIHPDENPDTEDDHDEPVAIGRQGGDPTAEDMADVEEIDGLEPATDPDTPLDGESVVKAVASHGKTWSGVASGDPAASDEDSVSSIAPLDDVDAAIWGDAFDTRSDDIAPADGPPELDSQDVQGPGMDMGVEPVQPPKAAEPPADTSPLVSPAVLAELIVRDLLGVAADAAESFETQGRGWPIGAVVLRAAAGSRAPHREYGPDTQRFLSLASRATSDVTSNLESVLLLGALLRPSLLEKSSASLRNSLPRLCRGSLGQHLQQVTEAISELDYDFPPDADELARLAGAQRAPRKQRIATLLGEWADAVSKKTSRWPFATAVMRQVASEAGPIGAARAAIDAGSPAAPELARQAIDALSSASGIEALSADHATHMGRTNARLHPKGVEYLERLFDEPLGLLSGWLRATEREGSHGQQSEARLRTVVGNLVSRLEKAHAGLTADANRDTDALTSAVSRWIAKQIHESRRALRGEDTGSFATLEEALTAERDLLPANVRDALETPAHCFDAFQHMLVAGAVPDPAGALHRAREEGAFDTAMRLATRFGIDAHDDIARDMTAFAEVWEAEITARSRKLKTLAKVDYKHQDQIGRDLSWCEITLNRLAAIKDLSEVHDLADVPMSTAALDVTSGMIEGKIRDDQIERIGQYRNERNAEEADALLAGLEGVTIEATEDRIAQLRDGRSAATFETDLGGLVSDFVPAFLDYAASPAWPTTDAAFENAVATEGPLYIEPSRRTAGLAFIRLYHAIAASTTKPQPDVPKVRALFEDIGYDNVKIHDFRPLGRTGVWQGRITGTIRAVRTDDWFLPPAFGSQANAGVIFLLVGAGALPENIMKALSSDTPSIILCAGTVDAVRRHELAERLRANAIPALLVDETLIAFTATRKHTRARTIFECGLPYGRIEPYTTDAGQLPPEMFFGRGEEIRLIMSKTAQGCLVYGGRQLGKSALLGHISRTYHAPEQDQIVTNREVRSLGNSEKTSEIWTHLASMLSPYVVKSGSRTAEEVSRDIRNWHMQKPHGRIVAMFDEADNFMDADTRDDYPELARLKKLMEDTGRAFKVVFAGLHNVQRMHRQPNSPLAHLDQPICIGPLNRTEDDKRAAHDLVVTPMRAAGFRFENHEAVEEILSWANYYPSLVQEYMKGLLSTLHGAGSGKSYALGSGGPLWPIPSDTLFSHRGFGHIESRIRNKFHLTLDLDPRYALVAYTLGRLNVEGQEDKARVTGFEPSELLDEARIFWPKNSETPAPAAFEALLDELFDLGVLGRVPVAQTKRSRYLLGSRQVVTMLGSEADIYHALSEIEEKDPAVAYDRAIHRRRYTTGSVSDSAEGHYCPLTDLQIERIVQPEDYPVQIVCGLEALGLSRVGPSLRWIARSGHIPGAPARGLSVELIKNTRDLRTRIDHDIGGNQNSIIIYSPETPKQAREAISWLERQPQVLSRRVHPLVLLDAAETGMRDIATGRLEQSQFLAAWGAEMVRVHLQHIEKVELDTRDFRDAILATTGGIPSETVKLIAEMRVATDPMEVAREWKPTLRVPLALLNGAMGKALVMLDMSDGEDYEALNDLVREHTGADLFDLGPDLVATGLVSVWKPKSGRIRRSALGDLLSRQIET